MNRDDDVPIMYEQQLEDYEKENKLNPLITIYSGLYFMLLIISIYLSIKCNALRCAGPKNFFDKISLGSKNVSLYA